MINLIYNMKYLVNFQIELAIKYSKKIKFRCTHTILESEVEKKLLQNFDTIKDWFVEYFREKPLDNFIDVPKLDREYNVEMKVGRITNSIDGKYKTF
ncbi:MAG: hypothetical protein CMJ08_04145 [Pelagibacterales bacterium]|nr:hypothetical protein [Pelagibacterales bacterium]